MTALACLLLRAALVAPLAAAPIAARPAARPATDPPGARQTREDARPEAERSASVERRLVAWRDLIELDLSYELAREGPAALERDPALARDGEAVALVARALREAGDAAGADALLERARPGPGTRAWIVLERARVAIAEDRLDDALALLAPEGASPPAPVRFPEIPESWLYLGRALVRSGRAAEAVPLLERFVALAPRHREASSAWYMLAQSALGRRDVARANECRARAEELARWHSYYKARRLQVREHPSEPLPRLGLAQLFADAGDLARARAELDQLVALAPDFARGWALLAEVRRKQGQPREALSAYDTALELDASQPAWRFNRAMLRLTSGLPDGPTGARADLEALVSGPSGTEPRFLAAHLELARLLQAAGETAAARARYQRYRELGGTEPLE